MTKTKNGERSPLKIVVAIVAVIVVGLFVSAAFRISDYSKGHAADYDARSYVYSVQFGRYGDLYSTTLHDMDKQVTYSDEVKECRALAFYYEQAVLEHAYRVADDTDKADEFAQRMGEYEAQLGSISARAKMVRDLVAADAGA